MSFRIGLTSVTFRSRSPREICEIAQKNKIKYIEWGADVHATSPSAAGIIRDICDEHGITSCSIGSYVRAGEGDIAAFCRDCESAVILGAKRIRIWLGRKGSSELCDTDRKDIRRDVEIFAREAAERGLTIAFEFHKGTLSDTAESVTALIDEIGAPNVKTYWQPFSLGHDDEWLNIVTPYLSAVHVFAWDENFIRYPLCDQHDIWCNFINILNKKAPNVDLIFEFVKNDDEEQLSHDVAELRSIVGGI